MGTLIPARLIDALGELASVLERLPAPPLDDAAEAALLSLFLQKHCHIAPGELTKFSRFKNRFLEFADRHGPHNWSQKRLLRNLQPPVVYGCYRGNQRFLANVSLDRPGDPNAESVTVRAGRLVVPKRTRTAKTVVNADRVARRLSKNGFSAAEIAAHFSHRGIVGLDDQPLSAEAVDALLDDAESEDVAATVRQLVSHLNSLTQKG